MRTLIAIATCITLGTLGACAGGDRVAGNSPTPSLAACAQGTALLTVSPIALSDIGGWVPLGNVGPPAHTFPTDHQYLYLATFGTPAAQRPVDLVAPGTSRHRGASHHVLDRRARRLLAVVLGVRRCAGGVRSRRVAHAVAALATWRVRPELLHVHAESRAQRHRLLHARGRRACPGWRDVRHGRWHTEPGESRFQLLGSTRDRAPVRESGALGRKQQRVRQLPHRSGERLLRGASTVRHRRQGRKLRRTHASHRGAGWWHDRARRSGYGAGLMAQSVAADTSGDATPRNRSR